MKKNVTLLFLLIPFITLRAQVLYTDVQPDSLVAADISTQIAHYFLDLNNDGTADFEIRHFFPDAANAAVELHPQNDAEVIVLPSTGITDFPVAMDSLDNIDAAANFIATSATFYLNNSGTQGDWIGADAKFLGLRIKLAGQWHYGWCQLDVPTDAASFTVKSYAVELTPNTPISAGSTTPTSISEHSYNSDFVISLLQRQLTIKRNRLSPTATSGQLIRLNGQVIRSFTFYGVEEQLNLSDVATGIYLLVIQNEKQGVAYKLAVP